MWRQRIKNVLRHHLEQIMLMQLVSFKKDKQTKFIVELAPVIQTDFSRSSESVEVVVMRMAVN